MVENDGNIDFDFYIKALKKSLIPMENALQ